MIGTLLELLIFLITHRMNNRKLYYEIVPHKFA